MMRRVVCVLTMAAAVAFGFLQSYEVAPTRADWSGWTSWGGYVGQTFVANFDSVCYCELFVGKAV